MLAELGDGVQHLGVESAPEPIVRELQEAAFEPLLPPRPRLDTGEMKTTSQLERLAMVLRLGTVPHEND